MKILASIICVLLPLLGQGRLMVCYLRWFEQRWFSPLGVGQSQSLPPGRKERIRFLPVLAGVSSLHSKRETFKMQA